MAIILQGAWSADGASFVLEVQGEGAGRAED